MPWLPPCWRDYFPKPACSSQMIKSPRRRHEESRVSSIRHTILLIQKHMRSSEGYLEINHQNLGYCPRLDAVFTLSCVFYPHPVHSPRTEFEGRRVPTSPRATGGRLRRRAHFNVFILSVTACVQAPVGSLVMTGSEPLASSSFDGARVVGLLRACRRCRR